MEKRIRYTKEQVAEAFKRGYEGENSSANNYTFTVNAGFADSLMSGIVSYVKSLYDPERPIESIISFMGPGILWGLGFKWLAVLYEVASALGFDWMGFWQSIKEKFLSLLTDAKNTGKEIDVSSVVDSALKDHYTPKEDASALSGVVEKFKSMFSSAITQEEAISLKKLGMYLDKKYNGDVSLIKTSGIVGKLGSKLFPFFSKIITYVLTTALKSLGFAIAGGAVASTLGTIKTKEETNQQQSSQKQIALVKNPNINSKYTDKHSNDMKNIWIEKLNINDIEETLSSWAKDIYPQLETANFNSSEKFNKIVQMFKNRNKGAEDLDIISIPPPFERKIDIVNSFAGDVAKANTST